MEITLIKEAQELVSKIYLIESIESLDQLELREDEKDYVKKYFDQKTREGISFNRFTHYMHVVICPEEQGYKSWEKLRKAGDKLVYFFNKRKISDATIISLNVDKSFTLAFAEGMALGAYNFEKYKTPGENKARFSKIMIYDENLHEEEVNRLNNLVEACFHTRDLVNEPANELTARIFADKVSEMANNAGLQVKVFDKNEIIESGMTGLLTVNKGSVDEPTFIVMEWKPADATNDHPMCLWARGWYTIPGE
jgi:leucyl aminopeptidase